MEREEFLKQYDVDNNAVYKSNEDQVKKETVIDSILNQMEGENSCCSKLLGRLKILAEKLGCECTDDSIYDKPGSGATFETTVDNMREIVRGMDKNHSLLEQIVIELEGLI